jgi:hypothetical protein
MAGLTIVRTAGSSGNSAIYSSVLGRRHDISCIPDGASRWKGVWASALGQALRLVMRSDLPPFRSLDDFPSLSAAALPRGGNMIDIKFAARPFLAVRRL